MAATIHVNSVNLAICGSTHESNSSEAPLPRVGGFFHQKWVPAESPGRGGGVGPTNSGWLEGNFSPRSKTRDADVSATVPLQYLLQYPH
ncbi:unnamed protein product [Prunus armeniaca]